MQQQHFSCRFNYVAVYGTMQEIPVLLLKGRLGPNNHQQDAKTIMQAFERL